MLDITGRILDVFDDPDCRLVKQASQDGVSIPADVQASFCWDPSANAKLPDQFFALIDHDRNGHPVRKYAFDSSANTWLSGLYFLKQGHCLPKQTQTKIAANLVKGYQIHGLGVPSFLEKVAAGKESVPVPYESAYGPIDESMFALTRTVAEAQYPIVTWEHVKIADRFFDESWRLFTPEQRREFAVKLANRVHTLSRANEETKDPFSKLASAYCSAGKDPTKALSPQARLYSSQTPDMDKMKVAFFRRLKMARDRGATEFEQAYQTLFDNRGSYTIDKLAETLERIDRLSGADRFWGKGFWDPYDALLKVAADPDDAPACEEVPTTVGQVRKLAANKNLVAQKYGEKFAEELASDPVAVFTSLPTPDKQVLASLADSCS